MCMCSVAIEQGQADTCMRVHVHTVSVCECFNSSSCMRMHGCRRTADNAKPSRAKARHSSISLGARLCGGAVCSSCKEGKQSSIHVPSIANIKPVKHMMSSHMLRAAILVAWHLNTCSWVIYRYDRQCVLLPQLTYKPSHCRVGHVLHWHPRGSQK